MTIIHTHLRITAALHTNRIIGDEEVGVVSGWMMFQESGNIFLLWVTSVASSSVAACTAMFCS